jgi:valyl-tRNA synthetase
MEFTEKAPFSEVFIHGLIRDKQGRKMSKSLGNGIDPLEIVDEYGADALKFTLAYNCAAGQDILLDRDSFKMGSKFANKVWNASRYLLMNLEGRKFLEPASIQYSDLDRWILGRLDRAASQTAQALATWRFNDAAQTVYAYFWDDFCDWYIEASKISTRGGDDAEKDRATTVLLLVLEESLRLLHPFLPFVTEEIYGMLPNASGRLISRPWPQSDGARFDAALDARFESLKELVGLARTLRSEFQLPPEVKMPLEIRLGEGFVAGAFIRGQAPLVALLVGGPEPAFLDASAPKAKGSIALVGRGFELYCRVGEIVDLGRLIEKFDKEIRKENDFMTRLRGKLANQAFLDSAPAEIVAKEREKLAESESRAVKLKRYVEELS